jgi:hypothetical protein
MPDTLEEYDKAKARYDDNGKLIKPILPEPDTDTRLQDLEDSTVTSGFMGNLSEIQAAERASLEKPIQDMQAEEVKKREELAKLDARIDKIRQGQNAK